MFQSYAGAVSYSSDRGVIFFSSISSSANCASVSLNVGGFGGQKYKPLSCRTPNLHLEHYFAVLSASGTNKRRMRVDRSQ